MKKTIVIYILITTILLSGCTKVDINSTTDAYNYLINEVNKNNSLNIDSLKSEFKNLQYKDVTLDKILQISSEDIKDYSAHKFSDESGTITTFFENNIMIAIENEVKIDNSDIYIQYITNKDINEIVSTYKDSTSLRVRENSSDSKNQQQLITMTAEEISSDVLLIYPDLVKLLTENKKLSLNDVEKILNKKPIYLHNREINNLDAKLYTFDYNDSFIGVYADNKGIIQCLIASNLGVGQDIAKTSYDFEFNPHLPESTFRSSIYYINTLEKVHNFNNNILNILK